ncbi:MAG: bifunctional hydroxymethylpyrimidine kinase/phosphomethylpyrimidine kinase [Candidatus Helarchaeota archaeon]|nr:bifunctional hydroxymethylpyrimidine kinase/phosphomethylpyrimidine kinase [Candidatus Helarchaeota archaeon]
MLDLTKTALTIAGSDSGGGAGIQADLKTFAALGVHGTSVITAITAQDTKKVYEIFEVPLKIIEKQLIAVLNDFQINFAKTGMLYNKDTIELISKQIEEYKIKLILDPIIFAGSGSRLLKEEAEKSLIKSLFPKSLIITPNIIEAGKIIGDSIKNVDDMKEAAKKIIKLGPKAVLIKGGHLKSKKIVDILYFEDAFTSFEKNKINYQLHGTGCTLSAAITAYLTLENSLKESVVKAEDFIDFAIQYPIITKTEIFPVNPLAKLELESARFDIVENLKLAIKIIENEVRFTQLIPEVRTNIAMTIPNVKSTDYIATTEGRITVVNGYPKAIGRIHFGGIHHVPRLILSAQKFDPLITAAMNIRFSPKIFRACQKTGLSIIKIDRTKEPKDKAEIEGKSMSWIIEEAAKLNDGKIPDLIADEGALGKEAMIRLFGHSAIEVVDKAFQILKYLE